MRQRRFIMTAGDRKRPRVGVRSKEGEHCCISYPPSPANPASSPAPCYSWLQNDIYLWSAYKQTILFLVHTWQQNKACQLHSSALGSSLPTLPTKIGMDCLYLAPQVNTITNQKWVYHFAISYSIQDFRPTPTQKQFIQILRSPHATVKFSY